ncbi:hypothetical protein L0156_15220 [bacterium]|nr:hypothetical protein [bacterium]
MKKNGRRRTAKITPELASILEKQEQLFVERFGREMGPNDLIFFNLDPEEVKRQVIEAMEKTGIAPELIYAFRKTGRILRKKDRKSLTREELKEWDDAINEYFEIEKNVH